ncbi:MAG: hypothetical protein ACFFFH_15715 [Candidatus Thorarchaeota archaeon]
MNFGLVGIPLFVLIILGIVIYFFFQVIGQKLLSLEVIIAKLNYIIATFLVVSLLDFFVGAFFPFLDGLTFEIQIFFLGTSFLVSMISIPFLFALRSVYPFDIANKPLLRSFLYISMTLVIISQITATLTLGLEIIAKFSDISQLIGNFFIFESADAFILVDISETEANYTILVLILILRSFFVFSHHSAIIMGYLGALLIFSEWGVAMRDPVIGFFKTFCYGYLLQGIGQSLVGIWLIADSFGVIINLELIQFVGGALATTGIIIYYISFAITCLNLLGNIEHLVFPQWLINVLKASAVIIPLIYSILYAINLVGSLIAMIFLPELYPFLDFVIELTHIADIFGVWLVPLAAGAFFMAAYVRSKEKPNVKFSSFLILSFLTVLLLFFAGNNTLTLISWLGLIHGQFGVVGILFFMYSLSRVAEHASRHRQVIRKIRENPEDFMFLAELGRSERKLQAWAKIDAMSKEGIIKPLTPIPEKKDETLIAAEVNSYMAEIEAIRKQRESRRAMKRETVSYRS